MDASWVRSWDRGRCVTFSLAKQHLNQRNFTLFHSVFGALQFLTDAEARDLISVASVSGIPQLQMVLIHIIKLNSNAPPKGAYMTNVDWVYRGCAVAPFEVKKTGFLPKGTSDSIYEHKRSTGISRYVSCTKDLNIAVSFAQGRSLIQQAVGYVYKIKAVGGIDCKMWFDPVPEFHADEAEVLFHQKVLPRQILGWASVNNPSDFRPL
jgi:hypothetical protein